MKCSLRSLMTFSIRDLLWLMVVVSLGLALWVDRRSIQQLQQDRDIWKYHANGARLLTSSNPPFTDIEINGKVMTAKHPKYGTVTRTWPESIAVRQPPAKLPDSSAPAPNPPKP
jgi:hypothetical protein